jgi:poly(3-hydroxybutyrate) depolymerase
MNLKIKNTRLYSKALLLVIVCFSAEFSHANTIENETDSALVNKRSAGCGITQVGTGKFMQMKIRVLDQDRKYHLLVPTNYDPNRAYPLIFRWHGAGGNGLRGGLGIEYSAKDNAIVVSAAAMGKYWRIYSDSIDLHLFDSMLDTISSQYCIDRNRIFSYGFSVGGTFSNLLACERGDVLRASATIASGFAGGNCKGKVATWLLHDQNDDAVPIAKGEAVRERAVATNGCSTNTIEEANGCLRYQGCDAAPVVWCESKGFGHNIRGDYAPAQVWKFFQSLP